MTPFSRTRTLVSALALLSVAGCGTVIPGTSVHQSSGDNSSGTANTDGAQGSNTGLSTALSRVGHTAAATGNYPTAVRMYRRAHDLAPDQVGPALGLARASAAVKDHRAAADAYRSVLRVEPNNNDALSGLGRELMSLDRPREAIPYLETSLSQRREAWVHNELGVAYEMTGSVGSAMEQYQSGLELSPRDLSLRTNLGRSLAWTGDYEAAIEILRAVAADTDATRRHRDTLALVFALGGDIPSAQSVSKIDNSAEDVEGKLAYFGLLSELARSEDRDAVAKVLAGSALRTVSASPRAGGAAPMVDQRDLAQRRAELEKMQKAREAAARAAARAAAAKRAAAKSMKSSASSERHARKVPKRVTRDPSTYRTKRATQRARAIPAKAVVGPSGNGPYAWTVQLAAFRTPARTEKGWKILSKVAPEVLMPLEHWVRNPNPNFKWDRLFRLRTYAFVDRRPAEEICARIKARNLECLVVRTQRVPGLQFASQSRVAKALPNVDTTTGKNKAAHVSTKGATKTVSRRTESPSRGTGKRAGAAGDVMKTAVDRQRSGATRTAKSRSPHPAYQVQLAVYKTEQRAEKGWRELTQAAPEILGKLGHAVQRTKARNSGTTLYRLRTLAYADQAPAREICAKLRRRNIQCIVVSTPDHAGLVYEPSEFEKANAPPPPPRQPQASVKRPRPQRHADAGWPKDFDAY